jgi:hypothetical protein
MEMTAAAADGRYELVYTEAIRMLAQQNSVLESLRTRATYLLSTTTLALTFAGGAGLLGQNAKPLPAWTLLVMLVGFLIVLGCTLVVLWPGAWTFGVSANQVIDDYIESPKPFTLDRTRRNLAIFAEREYDENEKRLDRKFWAFEAGAIVLVADVVVLFIGLLTR